MEPNSMKQYRINQNGMKTSSSNPSGEAVRAEKKALRRRMLDAAGAADPAAGAAADARICALLEALPEYRAARTVFCFVGTEREINTRPFLERVLADGKCLCVPRCRKKGEMDAKRIRSLDELEKGYYGLWEPPASCESIAPAALELAVIPCVSCSHDGARLGHGGGFYDIYFEAHPQIPTVMICREALICGQIPGEAHDLTFPTVITEKGLWRRGVLQS